jgi:ATP-binding cassette subfamily G (WHITE) protein 2
MSNLSGVELFIKERVIFIHESASGFYRVSAYFFSKIFCDFIPMRLVPLCLFSVIAYFMIGFQLRVDNFFFFFLALFLTTMSASAVCFAISASVSVFAIANLLSVLVFILMMIFGGLLVNIANLGDWISWLQYLSFIRYSLNALSINEMHSLTFTKTNDNGTVIFMMPGEQYLTEQGIAHDTAWDLWQNIMAMGIMAVGLMAIAYIQLRRMKKTEIN